MLERLVLHNFQKFDNLSVNFTPGVNCIVGPTESGKSSLLRALCWIVLGGSSGGFLKHDTNEVKSVLYLDGKRITRRRSKGNNSYRIDRGEAYRAVGTNVPVEIAALLNVGEFNVRRQLDPPFLITLPSPEVSRTLDRVINLDLIDRTLSALSVNLKRRRKTAEDAATEQDKLAQVVKDTEWVGEADRLLSQIEYLQDKVVEIDKQAGGLRQVARAIERAAESIREPPPQPEPLRKKITRLTELDREVRAICRSAQSIRDAEVKLCESKTSAEIARTRLEDLQATGCPLCGQPMGQ